MNMKIGFTFSIEIASGGVIVMIHRTGRTPEKDSKEEYVDKIIFKELDEAVVWLKEVGGVHL